MNEHFTTGQMNMAIIRSPRLLLLFGLWLLAGLILGFLVRAFDAPTFVAGLVFVVVIAGAVSTLILGAKRELRRQRSES